MISVHGLCGCRLRAFADGENFVLVIEGTIDPIGRPQFVSLTDAFSPSAAKLLVRELEKAAAVQHRHLAGDNPEKM